MRNEYSILAGNPEGKKPRGTPRRRWEDNIKIDIRERSWEGCGLDSSGSGYGLVAASCENGNEPSCSIKGWEFLD